MHKSAVYMLLVLCLSLSLLAAAKDEARIEQKLDAQIPLDAVFTTEKGEKKTLGEIMDGDKPVLLNIVFYRCATLCNASMNSISSALMEIKLEPGKDYQLITVSMDPTETPGLAYSKKQSYLSAYNQPGADQGWSYLVGEEAEIKKLTDSVGFYYYRSEMNNQYVHKSAIIAISPDGRVTQYLFPGVYDIPEQVRFALVNAGEGKVGSVADKVFLRFCATFDPEAGEFAPSAVKITRVVGVVIIIVLAATLVPFWFMGPGRRQKQAQTDKKQEVES